jgi:hypothetical protein
MTEHPAPSVRPLLPAFPMLWRGVALLGVTVASLAGARASLRAGRPLAPFAPPLALAGLLSGWAAAIHLTGGEKFDDRPG